MDRESSLCITNANINFPSDELLLNQSIKQLEKIIPTLEILTLSTLNITFMHVFRKGYKVTGGGCCIAGVQGTVSRAMADSVAHPSLASG